jgi:hypothetical protein
MYVWGLWIYDRPGCKPELWSLHYTQSGAEKAMQLTGKDGFVGRLSVKD